LQIDIFPEDEVAAGYAMMASLKCSLSTPCPTATLVNQRFVAAVLRLLVRTLKSAWMVNEVPVRPANG